MKALNKSKKGFTLIELLIVVVIIGILAAIAIPNFISMVSKAKDASIKSNMHTYQLAMEEMSTSTEGYYPFDAATTVNQIRTDLGLDNFQPCPQGEGDKSIGGAVFANGVPAGVCTFLPSTFRNPVKADVAWNSNYQWGPNPDPPTFLDINPADPAGCVVAVRWDNGTGPTAGNAGWPAYAIFGINSKGGDIGLRLVPGQ